jgi:D-lactate dehydrogenase
LADGFEAVCIFSADRACASTLKALYQYNIQYISLRSVGYDNVDLKTAKGLGIKIANVPAYSPYAIAEHAVALLLALNRHLIQANSRIQRFNFKLDDLVGFDLNTKTVGIVGTGRIGSVMAKIMHGFGCQLLGYDLEENVTLKENYQMNYTDLKSLCRQSDIISLHVPLNSKTRYLINKSLISEMKPGVILINTARGQVINTRDVLQALKNGKIGALGMDVYEKERGLFFKDHSKGLPDDGLLKDLKSLPNVLMTGHQAFLTREALTNIAQTTIENINTWDSGQNCVNEL